MKNRIYNLDNFRISPLDEVMDLLLVRFLPSQSLFLADLKLLEVTSNNPAIKVFLILLSHLKCSKYIPELLFKFKNFLFLLICSLCCPATLSIQIDVLTVDILIRKMIDGRVLKS